MSYWRQRFNLFFGRSYRPLLFGQFISSFLSLLFALFLISCSNEVYASNIAKALAMSSILSSILKLGSDNILISRLRFFKKSIIHTKLSLYASSYLVYSAILALISIALSLCIPFIFNVSSISVCLFSFGFVLLSYGSNFLITCDRLFFGLAIKPTLILASIYISHFFTVSLSFTAAIALVLSVIIFSVIFKFLGLYFLAPRIKFLLFLLRKSILSFVFSISQSAAYNVLIFTPNGFAISSSYMNFYQKIFNSSGIILRLLFIKKPLNFATLPLFSTSISILALSLIIVFLTPLPFALIVLLNYGFTLFLLNVAKISFVDNGLFSLVIVDQCVVFILFLVFGVTPLSLLSAALFNTFVLTRLSSK